MTQWSSESTIDDFFRGRDASRRLFDALSRRIQRLGESTIRVSKSQVAFRRRKNFAVVWVPAQYLKGGTTAPLVLTLAFGKRDPSPRWKEITKIAPGRFTHHLELHWPKDVDEEVGRWLLVAWKAAA